MELKRGVEDIIFDDSKSRDVLANSFSNASANDSHDLAD
jgi:hypothetical protein